MILFGGLVVINEFPYRFTKSVAFFELLALDEVVTDYGGDKKGDNDDKPSSYTSDNSVELNKQAIERMMARRAKRKAIEMGVDESLDWEIKDLSGLNTNTNTNE